MRVALIHDHLVQEGGAEKVLDTMREIWPNAPVYTLVYDKRTMRNFVNAGEIRTSFLGRVPGATRGYRWFLPFMPAATESYDLRDFDVVISSTSGFAKGVITDPETLHICYCHTPTRYLWSHTHDYIEESAPRTVQPIMPPFMNYLRTWDQAAAARVDHFVANSNTVRERIKKYYRKDSTVIHPPVDVDAMNIIPPDDSMGLYYVAGGRLVSYKRFDLLVRTFNNLGIPLIVFGDGPEMQKLKKMSWPNISFVGRVSDEEKARLYSGAVAYLHPQEEDFGITVAEAMACGTPVIAYKAGGATETVVDGISGVFFDEQSVAALSRTIKNFRPEKFYADKIREQALKFRKEIFISSFRDFVNSKHEEMVRKSDDQICKTTSYDSHTTFAHSM